VLTGTGRAAQIGRPVAGKTGTTSSNKDGWFIGFSSGLTTGVWMGRDNARAVAGLQGGTAPARAFQDFMTVAVANRPVQQFETQVPLPDWGLDADEQLPSGEYIEPYAGPMVDADGNPIFIDDSQGGAQQQRPIYEGDPGEVESNPPFRDPFAPQPQPQPQRLPQTLPPPPGPAQPPRSVPQPDPLQPRPPGA
jgi:penicillin-binding protein 1A